MRKNTFTEEEVINITIQHGYDGSEFKTAVWKNRGCLHTNRTLDALIRKLETIYHSVKVEGRGKKRKYTLTNKKDKITERNYNYKGTVPTVYDETMKEYIFNHLVENRKLSSMTYNMWSEEFELLQPMTLSTEILINEMKELHGGLFFNPNEIVSEFLNAINNHNYSIVKNSFNRLEREGRITQSSVYFIKTIEGNHEIVNKEEYEYALAYKKKFVESLGINYVHYTLSSRSFHINHKMNSILKQVNEQMEKKFKIKYMYETIKISVDDNKIKREINRTDFEQSYYRKFIKLSKDRSFRSDYQNSKSFWRSTYLMNTLKLLSLILKDIIVVEELAELMSEEMKRKTEGGFWCYSEEFEI